MLAVMGLDRHDIDEDGFHDTYECELCTEQTCSVSCECRCGNCCERLFLEASLRDAEREPRISAECGVIRDFDDEVTGYVLDDRSNQTACHFFNRELRLCTIYETRPMMCRVFNCDEERRSGELADLLTYEPDEAGGDSPSRLD
jgi:Fe-S-cluster containining protein